MAGIKVTLIFSCTGTDANRTLQDLRGLDSRFYPRVQIPWIKQTCIERSVHWVWKSRSTMFLPVLLARSHGWLTLNFPNSLLTDNLFSLFEAIRVIFGRACRNGPVFFTGSFSAGCPGEPEGPPCIPRKTPAEDVVCTSQSSPDDECEIGWSVFASNFSSSTTCQFAIYPLGIPNYMSVIYDEIAVAKKSLVYSSGKVCCALRIWRRGELCKLARRSSASPHRVLLPNCRQTLHRKSRARTNSLHALLCTCDTLTEDCAAGSN